MGTSSQAAVGFAEVVTFLSAPETYGLSGEAVGIEETHAAMVFLAGQHAYKIKKPVKLPYLDFSSLERRKEICVRELEINRPFAPELYLGIVTITRQPDGSLQLDGNGEPVEWAVHMRRFQREQMLDHLADLHGIDNTLAGAIAAMTDRLHALAPMSKSEDGVAPVKRVVDQLTSKFSGNPNIFEPALANEFAARAEEHLYAAAATLNERAAQGFIRRCHGDLHLANMVLLDGKLIAFDALEFDDSLATIDTFYDLAFLLMDLIWHRHTDAANGVLNGYLQLRDHFGELTGLSALRLFMAMRAGVRGLVAADRLAGADSTHVAQARADATDHLAFANDLLVPATSHVVAIGGVSGTGKSTLARALAGQISPAPGAIHLRTDAIRKQAAHLPLTSRLDSAHYTPAARALIYDQLLEATQAVCTAGWPVIADAVFLDPAQRQSIAGAAAQCGAGFTGFWLMAPEDLLKQRVRARTGDASDATSDVVTAQLATGPGEVDWHEIDASRPVDAIIAEIAGKLAL